MPGHGNHWETIRDVEEYIKEELSHELQESTLVCRAPCVDVGGGTEKPEEVFCLRYGGDRFTNQMLLVSNASGNNNLFFSGYPVSLDGNKYSVTIDRIEPWQYGIEGWVHGQANPGSASCSFFDTMFFNGTDLLQPGQVVEYSLSALAYWLRPISMRTFDVATGPLWEMEKQRRLEEGESEEEASKPVVFHMTGAAIYLPSGQDDYPDDVQIQGVIESLDSFQHAGQTIYRMELIVMRQDEGDFRIPVFASERVLDGYVPQLGEDVEASVWLQGYRTEG